MTTILAVAGFAVLFAAFVFVRPRSCQGCDGCAGSCRAGQEQNHG